MKKISNITQTYGHERREEIDNFLSEQNIKALNLLDIVTFSFHNSNREFINFAKSKILQKIPKCIFFEFNNIEYCESIIKYIENLKKLGITDFMLWQDDHYLNDFDCTFEIYEEIFNYYKNNYNMKYFKIFGMCYHIINKNINIINTYNVNNLIYVYETHSNEFKKSGYWAYTDENYLINIDFARNVFFKDEFKNFDVWKLEKHLKIISENNKLNIFLTNAYLFERCGIHGPNQREYSSSDKLSILKAKKYNSTIVKKEEKSIIEINSSIIKTAKSEIKPLVIKTKPLIVETSKSKINTIIETKTIVETKKEFKTIFNIFKKLFKKQK
jgi:hypothetical protein